MQQQTECATNRQQQVAVDSNKLHVWTGPLWPRIAMIMPHEANVSLPPDSLQYNRVGMFMTTFCLNNARLN